MYVRYPLSLCQVEDLRHECGTDICHETLPFVASCRRIRPVAGEHRRMPVDHAGSGSGLSQPMRSRMSVNWTRGIAI